MRTSTNHERLGLLMIASSLLVIAVIGGLLLKFQRDARREQTRTQGVSLVRLLTRIPYERLVPQDGRQGPLQVVKTSQGNPDFAYAMIQDLHGAALADATLPGVIVPFALLGDEPSAWIGERVLLSPQEDRRIREYFAPVLLDGERVADVRIGFFDPGFAIAFESASFFAMLALPIFLLSPLAYFVIRREVRPLAMATAQLSTLVEGDRFNQLTVEAGGEAGQLIHCFNRVVQLAESRLRGLEARQIDAVASSKIVSYQKARMETVLETLPDAIVVQDESGTVSFANAKLEPILGVEAEAAVGRKPAEWCSEPEVVAFLANYDGTASAWQRSDTIEFAPQDSPQKTISLSAHPLVTAVESPATSGTLVVVRDVTAATLAKRAQGEFVTHVAHELKSPLNVMSMYSESLLGKEGDAENFRIEACNAIQDEVERLSMLVTTLLSIARIETGAVVLDRQRVKLDEFLRDSLETVSRSGRRSGLEFELELPNELSPIRVDKELLRVSINNLLTNAIKYNRENGHVTLSAEETDEYVAIRVRDTGIGIDETEMGRVFEKFYRSESDEVRTRSGHGLGLALAKQIVELHGGEVEVESKRGVGSQFSLVLRKTAALLPEER